MSKLSAPGALEIKIATVVAVAATLHDADLAAIDGVLSDMTAGDASFFDREFAILDVAPLAASSASAGASRIDWAGLIALFRHHGLHPVAVRNASEAMLPEILAQGLGLDQASGQPRGLPVPTPGLAPAPAPAPVPAAAAPKPAPVATAPAPSAPSPAMIIDTPVRAGQRIYARGTDLIVTAAVNNGAELIADGSIHVYAPLRGRALAGASGNPDARIFALSMEAELISIAGVYRTFDDGFPDGVSHQTVQVRLAGDRLDILGLHATRV